MTAFGEQEKFIPAMADRLADHFLAPAITFCGIDYIDADLQRALQEFSHGGVCSVFVTDFGAAKTENRYLHIRFAKPSFLHWQ
jgi:hypothetical protein